MPREITREQALEAAWSRGLLSYKLRDYQRVLHQAMWNFILEPTCRMSATVISRQWGKSYTQNLVAVEFAVRCPGAQIRMAAPTRDALKKITMPIMKQILADCPAKFLPKWRDKDHMWIFPNGSEIHLGGANDGHADDLRGPRSHLSVIDEAGFVDDLDYLVDSIMMPQTLSTGGTLIITSTPPRSPAHSFVDIADLCKKNGHYIHRDIYSTGFSDETIGLYAKSCGGFESTNWKREYLALFVTDEALAITPEWSEKFKEAVEPGELHRFWHRYTSLDLGIRDNTAAVWAYYDFRKAQLVAEQELIVSGTKLVTPMLADGIRQKEAELGYDKVGVYRRVADNNNLQLLNDLRAIHGLPFFATSKDELPAMVNELRMWLGAGRIRVHPRCVNLIGCLEKGIWKNEANIGREFARSRAYGHFDALSALIYMVRNVDVHSNPVPADLGFNPHTQWINPTVLEQQSDNAAMIRNMFPRLGRR